MNETITQTHFRQSFAANEVSHELWQHSANQQPQAYYRSRSHASHSGINPLITAASALLQLNTQLKHLGQCQELNALYQSIVHEINAFETSAQNQGYRAETILIARYLLCAMLDETIVENLTNAQSYWSRHNLVSTFHRESNGDERFFLLLERLTEDPKPHLDLLELIYLCLRGGYKGKFRLPNHDKTLLIHIIDDLYHTIRSHRPEPKAIVTVYPMTLSLPNTQSPTLIKTILWTLVITLLCMGILYITFAVIFHSVTLPLQQQIQSMLQPIHYFTPT